MVEHVNPSRLAPVLKLIAREAGYHRSVTTEWLKCASCGEMLYRPRFERDLDVCADCGWHGPLSARRRLELLLDPGSVEPIECDLPVPDPLAFVDSQPYLDRLRAARARTGLKEAVSCVRGTIDGHDVAVAVMDFRFLGGSLGTVVGELITRTAEVAQRGRMPLVLVTASGGARMQEGILSLMQMAKTAQALAELDSAGILTVSVVTDPTFGGVAASYATLCDVIVAEPGARLGFAGPRVIEQTLGHPLPAGFQTAEFLLERGMIDMIRSRDSLRGTLAQLLQVDRHELASAPSGVRSRVFADPDALPEEDPFTVVRRARSLERPSTLDYVHGLCDEFVELRGDRVSGDCSAMVGGISWLDGLPIMVVGHQKGHSAEELRHRNFGMARPAGYRKSARLMRLAEKLGLPIVCFIDTPGAYPGPEAEAGGQAIAIAENLRLMAQLAVPVVSVILGEGGSGGALALGMADRVLICANAVYSVISPEGCAAILWKDASAAPTAAAALRLTARDLLQLGVVDGVVPEPDGGARVGDPAMLAEMRRALTVTLLDLLPMEALQLRAQRHAKFRAFGSWFSEVEHKELDGSRRVG